jgi:hypothetical protein
LIFITTTYVYGQNVSNLIYEPTWGTFDITQINKIVDKFEMEISYENKKLKLEEIENTNLNRKLVQLENQSVYLEKNNNFLWKSKLNNTLDHLQSALQKKEYLFQKIKKYKEHLIEKILSLISICNFKLKILLRIYQNNNQLNLHHVMVQIRNTIREKTKLKNSLLKIKNYFLNNYFISNPNDLILKLPKGQRNSGLMLALLLDKQKTLKTWMSREILLENKIHSEISLQKRIKKFLIFIKKSNKNFEKNQLIDQLKILKLLKQNQNWGERDELSKLEKQYRTNHGYLLEIQSYIKKLEAQIGHKNVAPAN